jgi:hypothetical protein
VSEAPAIPSAPVVDNLGLAIILFPLNVVAAFLAYVPQTM